MLLAVCALLSLAADGAATSAPTIVVEGEPSIVLAEGNYVPLPPGRARGIKLTGVQADDELVLEVVRIATAAGKAGVARVTLRIGADKKTVVVKAPADKQRVVEGGFASLPVMHQLRPALGNSLIEMKSDALVGVRVTATKRSGAPSGPVPLAPLGPSSTTPETTPATTTTTTTPPPPTTTPTEPTTPEPMPTAPTTTPPPTELPAPAPPTTSADCDGFLFAGELRLGVDVPFGGLQPIGGLGGFRVLAGPRCGLWGGARGRITAGVGVDFGLSFASVVPTSAADGTPIGDKPASWTASTTRLRLEALVDLYQAPVVDDLVDVRLSVGIATGARLALHYVDLPELAGASTAMLAVGVTARLEPQLALLFHGIPGSLLVALPVDGTVDVLSSVSGFEPLAVSLLVGYRLEL